MGIAASKPARDHPLLAAKLSVPIIRTPLVSRPRLLELVSHGVEGPLTVVSGAAGAGKTLLLASWIAAGRAPGPVAWVTLDDFDDQPGVFWAYVIEGFRRAGVELEDVGNPFLAEGVARPLLARVADRLARRAAPVVLVLDQLDVLGHRQIREDIDFVLHAAAPMLRLVLLTRNDGPLPLHRYELRGELVRIRNADLAFTRGEAADLLRQHGVQLTEQSLAALTEHTRGWAAGLRLSAVAMQRQTDPDLFAAALPDAGGTLARYLVDEVLDAQTAEIREFLLRTSIVDRLCPTLADALTGRSDGEEALATLRRGNVLIEELEQAPGCYRYHPLFTHVLRRELRRRGPDLVDELHRRASAWFEQTGLLIEAVGHAAAAADWQLATASLVRGLGLGALLAGRQRSQLDSTLEGLPEAEPGAMPAVVRAARAMTRFELDVCRDQLGLAEKLAGEEPEHHRAALLASTAVLRSILARTTGDLAAAEEALAEGEAQLASIPAVAAQHPELRALLLSNVGTVQLWNGRLDEAERTLRLGLAASVEPGCEYPRLNVLGRLAMIEFRKGHLRRAAQLGQDEVSFAEVNGLPVANRTGAGPLVLAMVAFEHGERETARRYLDDAERSVGARHDPFVATLVPLMRAWQHGRDPRRALDTLARVPSTVGGQPLPVWLAVWLAVAAATFHLARRDTDAAHAALDAVPGQNAELIVGRAAVLVATGEYARATQLLAPILGLDEPTFAAARVEAWVLTARIHLDGGDRTAALGALRRALALARPEERRRPFMAAGTRVRDLLRADPDLAAAHWWLGAPLVEPGAAVQRPTRTQTSEARLVEDLTERELAVLVRLAQAMSNEDIAQDLFLSVNTVKTHVRGVYRKLAVSRRSEAVRRGRELGLLEGA